MDKTGKTCPLCGRNMEIKKGTWKEFIERGNKMNSGQLREEMELQKKRRRELLQEKCKEMLTMRGYRRHDYGKNKTHCNRATERIAREMGYNTDWMRYPGKDGKPGIPGNANYMYIEALKAEVRGEITRVTQEEARKLAWDGEVVILTARSIKPGRSGHISVVYPTPVEAPLQVCNVGWDNLICEPEERESFGGGKSYLSPGIYFHLKKK